MLSQQSGPDQQMTGLTSLAATNPETSLRRRPRVRARWLMVAFIVLSAAVAWRISLTSPLELLELKTYDLRYVLGGKQVLPSGIILVLMDERTDRAIPDPHIFWHPYYAKVLRAASQGGARAIGLDVSFALSVEKWAPDLDRQMAAAFAEVSAATPVVLAYDNLQPLDEDLPLYILANTQGATGYANLTLDHDGFARRQELVSRDAAASESFAARLASIALNASWTHNDPARRTLQLGERTVPLDASGAMLIHYYGPGGTFPHVSMADVLRAAQLSDSASLEKWFKGNVVLIGTLDPSDRQTTPFYLSGGQDQLTPGVEIQANTLATLLDGHYLREVSQTGKIALVMAAALLAALCIVGLRFPVGPLALLGAVAGYLYGSVAMLASGTVLPVTAPLIAVVLSGLTSYAVEALTEGRQKRLLQDVFGRYVSAEMAQELLDYGEIPLGGTRQLVTVVFTDLRNYTSYCQGRDPHQVVEELNEYFADMSAEIKAHGGMINKFIGDGIMALFGAPVPHPDDARRAVACGLKMVERNRQYNDGRIARGLPPLVIGIGVHTGQVVVGNIGAPEKMEYTAIGDAVNIAARIEGENRTFGTQLLISEATCQLVSQQFTMAAGRSSKMKGIDETMNLYQVIGVR